MAVTGYELLFRDIGAPLSLGDRDGGALTPEGLLGPAADALGALVGSKRAFVNAAPCIITGETEMQAPPDRVVVEVGESVISDDPDLVGCRRLIDNGYTLA